MVGGSYSLIEDLTNENLVLVEGDTCWHLVIWVVAQLEIQNYHQPSDVVSVVTEPESYFPVAVPLASGVAAPHHYSA